MERLIGHQSLLSEMSTLRTKLLYARLREGEVITITHVSLNSKAQYNIDLQRIETILSNGYFKTNRRIVTYYLTTGDKICASKSVFQTGGDSFMSFSGWFLNQFKEGGCLYSEHNHFYYMSHELIDEEKSMINGLLEYHKLNN